MAPFKGVINDMYVRDISKKIADRGCNIISGLARGIDKYAHLGALESKNGKTIAVVGTGVDDESVYPLENKRIYERILEKGGTIISEYPIKTKPISYNFPARNRIISGLSDKILVVEANEESGSLITVDFALEQGKEVFAVPGKEKGTILIHYYYEGYDEANDEHIFEIRDTIVTPIFSKIED